MIEPRRSQRELFICCTPEELIPAGHILRRVDAVLDLSWAEEATAGLYCADNGRPAWHPELVLRLFLARELLGIGSHRALLRQAQTDLAIRWFIGCPPPEAVPDHSSLSRILRRWGPELFRRLFDQTVRQARAAGLVEGRTVHCDGTLMRADVSYESLYREATEEEPEPDPGVPRRRGRPRERVRVGKKRSRTDPDCTLATNAPGERLQPSYKHHLATCDRAGVVVAVVTTTGEVNEGTVLGELLEQVAQRTGRSPAVVTADSGYASAANYQRLEAQGAEAVIPPPREPRPKKLPKERFRISRRTGRAWCPAGRAMKPSGAEHFRGQGCGACALASRCLPDSATVRTIEVGPDDEAWVRAKRRHRRGWDSLYRHAYGRHRYLSEGTNGLLKRDHNLGRARWRGLPLATIQAHLAVAAHNLKKLAKAGGSRTAPGHRTSRRPQAA